jgi:2-polyprenyl-3-methyl-5-hydroxy-6-metoxy-1,4-benzoquinol methylase
MTQQRPATYDPYADRYAEMVAQREADAAHDPVLAPLLTEIGDVARLPTLDAACGEGYLARILARRGAVVTGMDLSPRLIALAQARTQPTQPSADAPPISYRVADLSQPLPDHADHVGRYALAVSNLALNDIADYQGFFTTVAALVTPGGRFVLSLNNPYSYVVRSHVTDYFDAGAPHLPHLYRGMAEQGVAVHFYQRTLAQYLDAAFAAGWRLRRLIDVATPEGSFTRRADTLLPVGYHFPFFMILSFDKV